MIGRLFAPLRGFGRGADTAARAAHRRDPALHAPGTREAASRDSAPVAPGEAFTPTRPKPGRRQAVGRQAELARILQALLEERAHVVLYSERGRGKTSLSNLVVEALRQSGVVVARYTCEAGSDFGDILRGLARDLPASLLAAPVGAEHGEGCEAALPRGELRPHDAVSLPPRLACRGLVCLVDEFDRVEDDATRTRVADAIKQLSDRGVGLLFLLVGVSENLEQILGQHPSIQRNLVAVPLPLLGDDEVAGLVATAGARAGFHFPPEAVARVAELARGTPYVAQLLGLRLAQSASARGDGVIRAEDFDAALARLIEDAPPRVQALYAGLTAHGRDAETAAALHWLAAAPQDRWGRLQAWFAPKGAVVVEGRAVSAACWERLQAAGVVQPCGVGSGLVAFADRALLHHVQAMSARHTPLGESLSALLGGSAGGHAAPDAAVAPAAAAHAAAHAASGTASGAGAGRRHSLVHGG